VVVFFSSGLYRICANSLGIYAQVALVIVTHEKVLGVRSTGENILLISVLVAHGNAFLVILTYEEVFDSV